MSDVETALILRMEATLNKFEKQMAKARKVGTDTVTGLERQFKRSNKQMASSAEESAQAMAREMDRLRSKYDPVFAASKRYEAALVELNRAHKVGALSTAQHERALETLNAEYQMAAVSGQRAATSMGRLRGSSSLSGSAIQNLSYQIGDFAVQVGAGTAASQALGQQLPQLLGGFGVMGAVMGAVVAVGIPLVRTLIDTGSASDQLEEQMKELESAVADYDAAIRNAIIPTDEIREKYGTATVAAREFLQALVDINQVQAITSLGEALETIATQFGGFSRATVSSFKDGVERATELEDTIANVASQFGVTSSEAEDLVGALERLSEAEGVRAQATAASDLLDLMIQTLGPINEMPDAAARLAQELAEAGVSAAEVQGNIDRTNFSIQDMMTGLSAAGTNLAALITQASSLGDNMYRAASAAWEFLRAKGAQGNSVGRGRGGDDRTMGGSFADWNAPENRTIVNPGTTPTIRRARRGGGGGRKGRREKDSLYEVGQKELENLERQIELIGKSDAEVAELTARYKLLDEAKKRGIDLDTMQAGSSKTVREQIDEQAAAIGRLTEKVENYKEQAAFMDGLNKELEDGFIDAIIEGENFGDVLANVAKQLAKAALQAALFNDGPLSGGGGGGGGGIFGFLSGLLTGKRAGGGGVRSGGAYLVNENTPRSEVFVPSQSGAILNVAQAQAALRAQSGAPSGGVARVIVEGGNLTLSDSGQISARIRVSSAQARQGAVQDVQGNWGAFQQHYQTDGDLV